MVRHHTGRYDYNKIKLGGLNKMKNCAEKQGKDNNRGKQVAKKRLNQIKKAVLCRDEKELKQLHSPSMWG